MGKINLKMYMTEESKIDAFIVLMLLWTLFSLAIIADSTFDDKEEIIRTYVSDPTFREHKNVEVVKYGLYWRDVHNATSNGAILSDNIDSGSNSVCCNGIFHTLVGTDSEEQIEAEIRDGEIEMISQLIEAEAGNQDFKGKCLVADVVLNRVASNIFPDTVEEVIQDRWPCVQFSTVSTLDGSYEKAGWYISDDSRKAAYQEYMAERRIDDRILSFTAGSYNPFFTPAYKYGDHYFGY